MERRYLETHPWLTFEFDLRMVRPETWINLGEVVRGALDSEAMPVDPRVNGELLARYRMAGIFGTAALDGSLAELGEVEAILAAAATEFEERVGEKGNGKAGSQGGGSRSNGNEGGAGTPPGDDLPAFPDSRAREIRNIHELFESIRGRVGRRDRVWDLSAGDIRDFNRKLLEGVEGSGGGSVAAKAGPGEVDVPQDPGGEEGAAGADPGEAGAARKGKAEAVPESVPGAIRTGPATEIAYEGVPAEDCEYLVGRLTTGLAELREGFPAGRETVSGIIRGLIAHLYLSWILPFDRANGRTARMAECQIMPNTARNSRPKVSSPLMTPATGLRRSCTGTTSNTATAASATSAQPRAILGRTRIFWRLDMPCTCRLAIATQRAGQAPRATGRTSKPSRSIRSAMPSLQHI